MAFADRAVALLRTIKHQSEAKTIANGSELVYYLRDPPCRVDGRATGCLRAARHFFCSGATMKTSVFVDGFNFYYGCFANGRNQTRKWVDLRSLCRAIVPNDTIHRIHYCTAIVKGTSSDPDKSVRQQVYLRALRGGARVTVHLGSFVEHPKTGMLASPPPCRANPPCLVGRVRVQIREEKGSDVNLATALLRDAFLGDFEQAIVISNDSDLAGAVRVVRVDTGLPIHVVSPHATVTNGLCRAATSCSVLDQKLLVHHQFASPLSLPDGTTLRKPRSW